MHYTDYLDIWQLHHVSFAEELDTLFGQDGAIRAIEEAKQQGLILFSGITGHHEPAVIATALQRYPFDMTLICLKIHTILVPLLPQFYPLHKHKTLASWR